MQRQIFEKSIEITHGNSETAAPSSNEAKRLAPHRAIRVNWKLVWELGCHLCNLISLQPKRILGIASAIKRGVPCRCIRAVTVLFPRSILSNCLRIQETRVKAEVPPHLYPPRQKSDRAVVIKEMQSPHHAVSSSSVQTSTISIISFDSQRPFLCLEKGTRRRAACDCFAAPNPARSAR